MKRYTSTIQIFMASKPSSPVNAHTKLLVSLYCSLSMCACVCVCFCTVHVVNVDCLLLPLILVSFRYVLSLVHDYFSVLLCSVAKCRLYNGCTLFTMLFICLRPKTVHGFETLIRTAWTSFGRIFFADVANVSLLITALRAFFLSSTTQYLNAQTTWCRLIYAFLPLWSRNGLILIYFRAPFVPHFKRLLTEMMLSIFNK